MQTQIYRILSHNKPNLRSSSLYPSSPSAAGTTARRIASGSSFFRESHAPRHHGHHFSTDARRSPAVAVRDPKRRLPEDGVTLHHFLAASQQPQPSATEHDDGGGGDPDGLGPVPTSAPLDRGEVGRAEDGAVSPKIIYKFHLKTYGCQMNVNDSDIVRAILLRSQDYGITFRETSVEMDAHVLLTNTCAIRENAETKVWNRLRELRAHDKKHPLRIDRLQTAPSDGDAVSFPGLRLPVDKKHDDRRPSRKNHRRRIIGVLGCTAERLKESVFEHGADLVVGPDAYRDLPRLVSALAPPPPPPHDPFETNSHHEASPLERALNVQLSLEETYADVVPVRSDPDKVSAFVSVMRGCNNMCSYCVVPFTRGRERSRKLESVVGEARRLYEEDGVREVVLLGQNVNSYHDRSAAGGEEEEDGAGYRTSNPGFRNLYRLRGGAGHYFADLVEAVSSVSPELRVRFTSPHPKDYPPTLLTLMAERHNVCSQLHMPAQSGSTGVLERMRRGYGREAYLELIDTVRGAIPDVALSSDFISGFCGETEEEHRETVSLVEGVGFDQAFMFAYSMRGKTHAHRTMEDDVEEGVKLKRLQEVIATFRAGVQARNEEVEMGRLRLVLVEGESKQSKEGRRSWSGRTDQNKRLVFPIVEETTAPGDGDTTVPACLSEEAVRPMLSSLSRDGLAGGKGAVTPGADVWMDRSVNGPKVPLVAGDYAVVRVTEVRGHSLKGRLLWRATMQGFHEMGLDKVLDDGAFGDGRSVLLPEQYRSRVSL